MICWKTTHLCPNASNEWKADDVQIVVLTKISSELTGFLSHNNSRSGRFFTFRDFSYVRSESTQEKSKLF